ncbi:translation initiation factor IF-2 subunit alpha [Candidatus Woesearchaeota archaeon]|nr:translation initiation factor IF-2 subunit alpha [Candidatus Woesearchaeota archaeon]
MLLKKTGFPTDEELVLCTVTGITPHSVFCTLDEYGGRTGMIHISEIAPGRIKNIREYVQEGKKVVCKVLQTNKEKGHIDLSLRRVNEMQKRNKLNQIKQEQLAEKIIEYSAKQQGDSVLTVYNKLAEKLVPKYGTIFAAFEQVAHDQLDLETLADKKIAKTLTDAIKQRIKPPIVKIDGTMKLTSYTPAGIEDIKEALSEAVKKGIDVRYLGAGAYHFEVQAGDYKEAEKKLKEAVDAVVELAEKHDVQAEWARTETA